MEHTGRLETTFRFSATAGRLTILSNEEIFEMRPGTVLIVENEAGLRDTYHDELQRRGFDVRSAGTVRAARDIVYELREQIDVALLDMRLHDLEEPNTTGADIGLELRQLCPQWTPEFLVRSQYAEVAYYKAALELGVAAYLAKLSRNDSDLDQVIRHVRALVLRRFLKIENPTVIDELNRIAATTKSVGHSILAFCEHTLAPHLSRCLGAPYVLLLTDAAGTQNCASNTDMPFGFERFYEVLQAMTHGNADPTTPYTFSMRHLDEAANATERYMTERLEGAAFVPLASVYDYRLSLGILKAAPEEKFPERPAELATVVARYVRSTVCENFIKILVQLDTKRRTMLKNTSQLCLALGQDQLAVVDEGLTRGDLKSESSTYQKLQLMAEDLEETGAILMNVADSAETAGTSRVEMAPLIKDTWQDLSRDLGLSGIDFSLSGNCSVVAEEEDLAVIVARVLQWLAQRKIATESPNKPAIVVGCEEDGRTAKVTFEDRSRRLPQALRDRLFLPFTLAVASPRNLPPSVNHGNTAEPTKRRPGLYLPLYLAKTLVEEKYRGYLDDNSDDMPDDAGHRLVIRLHKAFEASARTVSVA